MPYTQAVALLLALSWSASASDRIQGDYVEARTAEVFAGGCIMNSEAETAGRQAILAWRITSGAYRGVALDGLVMVAAVAGNRNLGMRELGGEAPDAVRAVITIDDRASAAQRAALAALAPELSRGLITEVVRVDSAPVQFRATEDTVVITGAPGVSLSVNKRIVHDASCGAMQWFTPFTTLTAPVMGTAESHEFSGTGLGSRWSAPHKRSAFWGSFSH
jgi:hypothetical protein